MPTRSYLSNLWTLTLSSCRGEYGRDQISFLYPNQPSENWMWKDYPQDHPTQGGQTRTSQTFGEVQNQGSPVALPLETRGVTMARKRLKPWQRNSFIQRTRWTDSILCSSCNHEIIFTRPTELRIKCHCGGWNNTDGNNFTPDYRPLKVERDESSPVKMFKLWA